MAIRKNEVFSRSKKRVVDFGGGFIGEKYYLGCSQLAIAAGISEQKTPVELYQDIISGINEDDNNEPCYWGHILEPIILGEFKRSEGCDLYVGEEIFNPSFPHWVAHLDARIKEGDPSLCYPVDAKSTTKFVVDSEDPDKISPEHFAQMQAIMAMLGVDRSYLAYLVAAKGGMKYVKKVLELEEDFVIHLREATNKFCECVESRTPPSPKNRSDIVSLYRDIEKSVMNGDSDTYDIVLRLLMLQDEEKNLKKEISKLKDNIALRMGKFTNLFYKGEEIITFNSVNTASRVDVEALKRDGLYEEYKIPGGKTRQMVVKLKTKKDKAVYEGV